MALLDHTSAVIYLRGRRRPVPAGQPRVRTVVRTAPRGHRRPDRSRPVPARGGRRLPGQRPAGHRPRGAGADGGAGPRRGRDAHLRDGQVPADRRGRPGVRGLRHLHRHHRPQNRPRRRSAGSTTSWSCGSASAPRSWRRRPGSWTRSPTRSRTTCGRRLRSLEGFSQALLEDHADGLPEEAQRYLGRIQANVTRMGQMIDDLLHLSKATRSQLRPRTHRSERAGPGGDGRADRPRPRPYGGLRSSRRPGRAG